MNINHDATTIDEKTSLLKSTDSIIKLENNQKFLWWERPDESRSKFQKIEINDKNEETGIEFGSLAPAHSKHENKLNQVLATAISGNDITSSVLYVSGYAAFVCGVYAPISLLLVAVLLALYRPIYTEVVTALPMNGGTYNALLNTTSKKIASVAGALSLLSYVATAVVSATSAMEYLQSIYPDLPIYYAVVGVLFLFAILNVIGITESAWVAVGLFFIHLTTLMVLIGFCLVYFIRHGTDLLVENWHTPYNTQYNAGTLIFLGYGVAMLGITGFETSANYVEEQAPGVFPKTLRNMWFAVAFFNPVIALLANCILPLSEQVASSGSLLSEMAYVAGGHWLKLWVGIDAVLVLSGAVLTAYVGVVGLGKRLALDRILPQFLLAENRLRKTCHWIIFAFFFLCSSLFLLIAHTKDPKVIVIDAVNTLSSVYTSAFLCVMAMFAISNMMLKYKRSRLPREIYTPWPVVIIAFLGVVTAFASNLIANPAVILPFIIYFGTTMLLFVLMFLRINILKIVLYFARMLFKSQKIQDAIALKIQQINSSKVIFFTRDDNISILNKAVLYIRDNEQTNWILMVCVTSKPEEVPARFEQNCRTLDEAYPKFRIDPVFVQGEFGPQMIDKLSELTGVPKNFMFITTPSEKFTHKLADFGGVRLVTR